MRKLKNNNEEDDGAGWNSESSRETYESGKIDFFRIFLSPTKKGLFSAAYSYVTPNHASTF